MGPSITDKRPLLSLAATLTAGKLSVDPLIIHHKRQAFSIILSQCAEKALINSELLVCV